MAKKKKSLDATKELCRLVVEGMQEKKAENIAVIDLTNNKNAVCDYFIIASGTSDTHVSSLIDSVEDFVQKNIQQKPSHREGKMQGEWVLLDYIDVVAHIFQKDKRAFFSLEQLWGDAPIEYIPS